MAGSPSLQRAFFSHGFAEACERAMGYAYVGVLYDNSEIRGFLPFQFRSAWHERFRLAERIGGNLAQGASLVAWPDVTIDSAALLRLCGVSVMHVTQLMSGQERFGLDAEWTQMGYFTDLNDGSDAYFAALLTRDRLLVRDTERRLRKAAQGYGRLSYIKSDRVSAEMIEGLVTEKREQYRRTQVPDPFVDKRNLQLFAALDDARAPDCRLVFNRLEAGNRVLAQHLGLQYHDVLSHWFPVYDPEARSVSPGRLLLWYMIQQAAEDGTKLIDYGAGDALYKRELSTGSLQYGRANWSSRGIRSIIARVWQSMEWRLQGRARRAQTAATD
jgi:CelD/BcsL family acetyltransferase involved in cellulose biosynthesis